MRWLTLRKPGEMISPRMKSAMIAATAMASRE
jgi:hypothetical protein